MALVRTSATPDGDADTLSVVELSEPGARVFIDQVGRSRRPIRFEATDSGDLT